MATPATDDTAIRQQLTRACEELDRRLCAGVPGGAVELLDEFPDLARDKTAVLELVYTEFVIRKERGEQPVPEDWYARLPTWETDLRELFQIDSHVRRETDASTIIGPGADVQRLPPTSPHGRRVGDYELFEELGRGGMAVVYRARQISLNRIVALKMIPGGEHADQRIITRFRREAEAVARLQHPNIVQIYEVGELDGIPYFAMEFVEGGPLSRELASNPLPARSAAGLLQELARAIEYAHAHGVIHRDLKPANVLLSGDRNQGTADRETRDAGPDVGLTPGSWILSAKITDFGLAKLLASEGTLTESGAVLGTPGYMPPEQASGDAKRVGPEADVYALGAILYECLTGRPPFTGGSAWRAMMNALDATPIAPSRLRAGIPRDLETICLKCLEKEPARRYRTALALAEDLRRFLNNETIRARPPGVFYQFGKFARRNRVAVAGVVCVFLALVAGLVGTGIGLSRESAARKRAENAEWDARRLLTDSYVSAAELAMQRGAWRVAIENLDKALAADPTDPVRLRLLKVRALCGLHDAPEALAELQKLSERSDLGTRKGEVLLWQADIALARKTDEAGLELVRQALEYPLPQADAAYARGLLAKSVPDAVGHFQQALKLDPFHHRANAMVATLYILQGEMTAAHERARFGAEMFPEDPTFAVLLAMIHAWEGNAAAADAEVERSRAHLGERQVAAVRALLDLTRAARGLGEALTAMDEPRQFAAIQAFVSAGGKTLREVEALRDIGRRDGVAGTLLLPTSPAFVKALERIAAAFGRASGARIERLRQASEIHSDGLLLFFLGVELANAGRHAEAWEAFRIAADRPSFVPVRRPALYALTAVEWELATKMQLRIARHWWNARAVTSARRFLAYGRLQLHEVEVIVAAAYYAGRHNLVRAAVEQWERQGGEPNRLLLQHLMKTEYEAGSYGTAVRLADQILARWPGDNAATLYRVAALHELRKQADELLTPKP